jgi:hypothetical protein
VPAEQWPVGARVRLVGVVLVGVGLVGVAGVVAAGVVVGAAGVVVTLGEAGVCAWVFDATGWGVERAVAAAGTVRVAAFAAPTTPMTAADANTEEPRRLACAGEFPVTATDLLSTDILSAGS